MDVVEYFRLECWSPLRFRSRSTLAYNPSVPLCRYSPGSSIHRCTVTEVDGAAVEGVVTSTRTSGPATLISAGHTGRPSVQGKIHGRFSETSLRGCSKLSPCGVLGRG